VPRTPTIAEERAWSERLRTLVARRAETERSTIADRDTAIAEERKEFDHVFGSVTTAFDNEHAELAERFQSAYATAATKWETALADHQAKSSTRIAARQAYYERERQQAVQKRDDAVWLVGSVLDEQSADSPLQQLHRLESQVEGTQVELQHAVQTADELFRQATEYLDSARFSTEVGVIEADSMPTDLATLREACLKAAQDAETPYRRLMSLWLPRLFVGFRPILVFLALAAALGGAVWSLVEPGLIGVKSQPQDPIWMGIVFVSSAAIVLVAMLILHVIAGQRLFALLTELFSHCRTAQVLRSRWEGVARHEIEDAEHDCGLRHNRRLSQRDDALQRAAIEFAERSRELNAARDTELTTLQSESAARYLKIEQDRDIELNRLQRSANEAIVEFDTRRRESTAELHAHHQQRVIEIERQYREQWDRVVHDWHSGLSELTTAARDWESVPALRRTWTEMVRAALSHPDSEAPPAFPLGQLRIGLAQLPDGVPKLADLQPDTSAWKLPVVFDLPTRPGLLIRTRDPAGHRAAVDVVQATTLRLLDVLPPGRVRFTILDPISLGEHFAAFMHLADADELLVTSRIWTEPGQIEQRLADLTEHMETVLQMFLRNEYASLDEYNRQAGEVAEPYRVLVVSGFPTSFTDIAMRRLWNIVTSGARCGVIPLIVASETAPLPRGFALTDLDPYVTALEQHDGELRVRDAELSHWPVDWVTPPTGTELSELLKRYGERAGDVRRVQVPFAKVAPNPEAIWTASAARGIAVPIGRAGATKQQAVSLGSGTSQHVLVAGKTGSGKSTLLHALITNAALHYSPHELELYLVDFKKGVEFKTYARGGLPHARVIGIESDREFGVSVLERLDAILEERSTQFREAGVPDLAGFRLKRPDQPMPRILLIIDEFQEFFVEDDPLSQSASLLLDRLIRQGRAFGVHVVLGSQTLAGAYSLARSTLGQVAVRIALQCSETDAHLILSEENSAARLLTRPGEAIYNDANGLTAGNHLFQVVWLEEEYRDRYLALMAERAGQHNWQLAPPIIFEGNVPADLAGMPTRELLNGHARSAVVTAWLGEAVSLRGPLGLDFAAAAGNHLLLTGQDEPAAVGVLSAAALSVARNAVDSGRTILFNGSPTDRTVAAWNEVIAATPQTTLHDIAELEPQLDALLDEIRQRDGRPGPRIWLCLFDLVRFRKLRKSDDDFGFGGFDKKAAASLSDRLAEILRDGPSVGVHVWVWADSINTLNRWFTRDMQQQFEYRVAFAMNSADSSQFIDSPAAAKLGVNRAWLFRGDRGTLDKFRPYQAPRVGWTAAANPAVAN
jgi:S-DNA-T family DNA segregation ATPase FtsK/SpoIIIE